MICTTLNKIREHNPCQSGWQKLLAGLNKAGPDDELLPMVTILDLNGLDDALWALRATDCDRESRLLAVAYARQVQHLMADPRSVAALDVAERFANGRATLEELIEAHTDALAAVWDAACAAVYTAGVAELAAACAAVNAAAEAAALAAAWAAVNAARAAARAAEDDAAMREKQVELFKEMLG